ANVPGERRVHPRQVASLPTISSSMFSDTEFFCQFRTDCILPCSFNIGDEVVIHWILKPGDIQVHSYYYDKDQLDRQDQRYKGRTSLHPEQFSRGNASLRLNDVGIRDEGRYQCYTSTVNGNKETYIQLRVYGTKTFTLHLNMKSDNNLICSSDGIYPEPNLIWTIGSQHDPPKPPSISRTESQLYSISSSIPYNLNGSHNAATCRVSTTKDQKEVCVLPCSFQPADGPAVHWTQLAAGGSAVHSYYDGRDQVQHQNQNFRGRTSLFVDQVASGNASLLLTGVKVQDQGRYVCNCSRSAVVRLQNKTPVSDIRIHQDGNRITCSSEGIYPQPELTWSTEPPSNTALQNRTTVHQTEEKLYDISSSLTGPDGSDLTYSCSIRTRRNQRRATLHKLSKNQNLGAPHSLETSVFKDFILIQLLIFSCFEKINKDSSV
uniref:Ig-like domain-containing protein n=1 Tax=Poecilia reticulata TaxID=8081 RepID=A0A3P9QI03_POERE